MWDARHAERGPGGLLPLVIILVLLLLIAMALGTNHAELQHEFAPAALYQTSGVLTAGPVMLP